MQEDGEERRHNSTPADGLAAGRQGCGNRDAHPAIRTGHRAGDRALNRAAMGEGERDHVGAPSSRIRASSAASSTAQSQPAAGAPLSS